MGSLPEGLAVVDVPGDEDIEQSVQRIQAAARQVHAGEGVVFLTDLFGATPSNAAVRAGVESLSLPTVLVSGCNLPMVLRALGFRDLPINEVAERKGHNVVLEAEGSDEAEAIAALVALIDDKFGEG
eukprot:gene19147-19026_t